MTISWEDDEDDERQPYDRGQEPRTGFPDPCPSVERCACGSICEAREAWES